MVVSLTDKTVKVIIFVLISRRGKKDTNTEQYIKER